MIMSADKISGVDRAAEGIEVASAADLVGLSEAVRDQVFKKATKFITKLFELLGEHANSVRFMFQSTEICAGSFNMRVDYHNKAIFDQNVRPVFNEHGIDVFYLEGKHPMIRFSAEVLDNLIGEENEQAEEREVGDEGVEVAEVTRSTKERVAAIMDEVMVAADAKARLVELAVKITERIDRDMSGVYWDCENVEVTDKGNLAIPFELSGLSTNVAGIPSIMILQALHISSKEDISSKLILSRERVADLLRG